MNKILNLSPLLCALLFVLIFVFCADLPFSPNSADPSISIVLGDLRQSPDGTWLSDLLPTGGREANHANALNKSITNRAVIDEVKILVLDMTQWESEAEFRQAWEAMNESALIDTTNQDSTKDFLDNVVRMFQSYTGDKYRFAGEFTLEIDGSVARGTINAKPGLNYFFIALREQGTTQLWFERFFTVSENEELNTICFGCGPEVRITFPPEDTTFTTNVINVSGTVGDDTVSTAKLILGEVSQTIPVNNGQFSNPVVLSVGTNTIIVQASNADGTGSDRVTVEFQGDSTALRATLIWDTNGTDMDLQMENPNGEVCSFVNPEIGGMKLDVDDADGFGPENISVNQPISGEYITRVVNFSASAGFGTTATVYIFRDETLLEIRNHTFSVSDVNNTWEASRDTLP